LLAFGRRGSSPRVPLVEVSRLPRHVAIIMDGNGRWAQQLGQPRTNGHREGSEAVRRIVRASRRLGLRALTLYAFSEQNWARPRDEVDSLMHLLHDFLHSERDELLGNHIRLRAVGRVDRLPRFVREVLSGIERETGQSESAMTLSLALSYGGREEIADAARALAERVATRELDPAAIDEARLEAEMRSMDVGPVDLLVRTGGEQRISNFLLWGAAYAELIFSPRLWPDWEARDLYEAIEAFQTRDRRFGRVKSDVATPDEPSEPAAPSAPSARAAHG
jgi:undecaprenyl diphosphate synthase